MYTPLSLSPDGVNRIARYCGEEVRRQYANVWEPDLALRVSGMIEAWMDAIKRQFYGELITPYAIKSWGASIEPRNAKGFRRVPIFVGLQQKLPWQLVDKSIEDFTQAVFEERFDPFESYREFEEIHPFEDGNGRTGKIILNWVNGTLLDPIFPPDDFWGPRIINP